MFNQLLLGIFSSSFRSLVDAKRCLGFLSCHFIENSYSLNSNKYLGCVICEVLYYDMLYIPYLISSSPQSSKSTVIILI